MEKLLPWMWEAWQMPAREVRKLTPRELHTFVEQGLQRQASRR